MKHFLSLLLLFFAGLAHAQNDLQEDLSLKYLVQQPTEKSAHPPVVILLHGYGSNEQDLFGLRNMIFPKNFLIICARAPLTLRPGGYQWYELTESNGKREGNMAQAEASRQLLIAFIEQAAKKYDIDTNEVYLAGFSQGAIMSYFTGLTDTGRVRGIVALSGRLPQNMPEHMPELSTTQKLNIFIAHGTADPMIPVSQGEDAAQYLINHGLHPELHIYENMTHTINNDVIRDLRAWFLQLQTKP
jgi:phospholipase/carboxylesterase